MKISASPKVIAFRLSLSLCAVSLIFVAAMVYSYFNEKHQKIREAKNGAREEAVRAAKEIDAELQKLSKTAVAIADDLTSGKLPENQIQERLRLEMDQNPSISGLGAAYKPYAYPKDAQPGQKVPLYAPYYTRKGGKIEYQPVEKYYAYTQPQYEWYHKPIKEGASWIEPFFSNINPNLIAPFGTPFYRNDPATQKPVVAGVVTANYSLEELRNLIKSLTIGKTGYGFLLSHKGNFIYHPIERLVESKTNILERAKNVLKDELLLETSQKALAGESVVMDDRSAVTGQSTWLFFEPIPSTGWALGVVFIKDEIFTNTDSLRHKLIWIALGSISTLFFLSIIVFRAYEGRFWSLWFVSITTSGLLGGGVGLIWYLSFIERPDKTTEHTVIVSQPGLQSFLESRNKIDKQLKKTPATYIPTGIFIQSIEFQGANNVFITGYLWQKYTKGIHDDISRGFIFPESVTGTDFEPVEAYRYETDTQEVIGWYFETAIRQNFDYNRYPFDAKDVWLRIWHQDFYKNVILVPDVDSYKLMNPTSIPGVEKDFVLPGWHLESSFFHYRINSYNTYFGFPQAADAYQEVPELYFTIIAKRNFLTVFISNVMPSMVLACLLFVIQMIISEKHRVNEAMSFTAMEIVSTSGAFIFIVILDQINLRNSIAAGGIIYLEFFYFILYIIILWVTVNALILASGTKIALLDYQDNFIPKLLYWPFFLKVLLIVTLIAFY
ncbi:cache domain-containing protein [[Phormidium] sp. ETS-05]|uniref:cache domain-containing protein n=1 Tax=[Phormidium] sp. ETS-05 TaxID=222819 RepID=UPI0018EF1126|nr:cache domain-containing protein [[Phormidium] sp. ETS-05]